MGLDLLVPKGDFRDTGTYDVPVPSGCIGWYFLGGTLAASIRNHAPLGKSATVAGSPTVNDNYLGLVSQNSYIDTGIIGPASGGTYIVVGRAFGDGTTQAQRFSHIGKSGGGATGAFFQSIGPSSVEFVSYHNDGAGGGRNENDEHLNQLHRVVLAGCGFRQQWTNFPQQDYWSERHDCGEQRCIRS
mgnify:CR=1 FL=1|jgi:hypothetical protein